MYVCMLMAVMMEVMMVFVYTNKNIECYVGTRKVINIYLKIVLDPLFTFLNISFKSCSGFWYKQRDLLKQHSHKYKSDQVIVLN